MTTVEATKQTTLTLSETEAKVVSEALVKYYTAKSAEKMLKGQAARKKDVEESYKIYAQYSRLLAIVIGVQEKLNRASE